jgi:opacity protein-like surface antigen
VGGKGLRSEVLNFERAACNSGAAAIEFGLTAPIFLIFIIALYQFGLIFVAQNALDAAAREASRFGITGQTGSGSREGAIDNQIRATVDQFSGGIVDTGSDNFSISVSSYSSLDDVGKPEPFIDADGNGAYDVGEVYTDVNGNDQYDTDQGISGSYGSGGQAVRYTISYVWPFSLKDMLGMQFELTLKAIAVVVNEEFN